MSEQLDVINARVVKLDREEVERAVMAKAVDIIFSKTVVDQLDDLQSNVKERLGPHFERVIRKSLADPTMARRFQAAVIELALDALQNHPEVRMMIAAAVESWLATAMAQAAPVAVAAIKDKIVGALK